MHDTPLHGGREEGEHTDPRGYSPPPVTQVERPAPTPAPPRREPVYSAEYIDAAVRRAEARHERVAARYSLRVATAHHAIRMALMALEHGNVERAVRELRKGGALSTKELQETRS